MQNLTTREVQFEDESLICELLSRNGLISNPSERTWNRLWSNNPAYFEKWPLGWVLEENNKIVGYIGNIPLRYYINERLIKVACGHGYVVDPEARSHSLKLLASFFTQKHADLLILTTANESSAKIYKMCGAIPLPDNSFKETLTWINQCSGSLKSVLLKKKLFPRFSLSIVAMFLAPPLSIWLHFRGHGHNKRTTNSFEGQIKSIPINGINGQFDQLWENRKKELPNTLLSERSAEIIRWHYDLSEVREDNSVIVLQAMENKELLGYLVLNRVDAKDIELKRFRITDLFVSMDNKNIIDALLKKAFHLAKLEKVHLIETIGFPVWVRKRLLSTRPLSRTHSAPLFWYYTNDKTLAKELSHSEAWYATPFDGDSSL